MLLSARLNIILQTVTSAASLAHRLRSLRLAAMSLLMPSAARNKRIRRVTGESVRGDEMGMTTMQRTKIMVEMQHY